MARTTQRQETTNDLDLEAPRPIHKGNAHDTRIPEHPRYRATSDGHVVGFDPLHPNEPESRMGQFWDPIGKRLMVIVYCKRRQTSEWIPLAFPAAELIARGYGAPAGFTPGFRDTNPMNLKRSNLILPADMRDAPIAKGEGAQPVGASTKGA